MASLPAASASSPGGHTGHAPDLATALQQGGPVLNPAGTLVGQARLMHAVLTHRRSADVFSTGDVWSMIRNLKTVRDTTGSNGPVTPRDLAISTCERLLEGGLVVEVSMTKRTKGPQMRYFRKRPWAEIENDEERAALCKSLKLGSAAFHGTVDCEA